MKKAKLLTPKTTYTFDYPQAIQFADTQMSIFWLPTEINTEKDVQDLMVNMSEAERHGVITTLKLFTLYELAIGNEYWGGKVKKYFKRPDIERMANCFSFFELNVHAPFYNQINEAMMLDTDEFYESYIDDPELKSRMDFIDELVASKDLPTSLAIFSMVEGAVLYSNFAFLKHFQARGKNKLNNVVRGINFSVKDEHLHSEAGAWLYRTLISELGLSAEQKREIEDKIIEAAHKVYEHECRIVDMIFEKGSIEGITAKQLQNFVASRVDLCLQNLGVGAIFNVKHNPIASWFYDSISTIQFGDFFAGTNSEYNRNWDESRFTW